jgi:hypothetical protein
MPEIIDTCILLHEPMIEYWTQEHQEYEQRYKHNMQSRFRRAEGLGTIKSTNGDAMVERIQDIFMNGLDIEWSVVQIRVFQAMLDGILPRIYGTEWEEVKGRVMAQRGIDRLHQETLVNMARRNGKTWVVSGGAAAVFLVVPAITIAVFSVGKRQATMFMNSTMEKIERAFKKGTHVNRNDYSLVAKNQESLIYEHPEGGKQVLGCYPGSTKVRKNIPTPPLLFFFLKQSMNFSI